MRHLNILSVLFIATALFIAGCQTSSASSPWQYKEAAPAQAAPSSITTAETTQVAGLTYTPPAAPGVGPAAVEQQPLDAPSAEIPPLAAAPDSSIAKVAILLPLSGQHANLGNAMLKAAQMALFDIGGGAIELLPRDTKGTSEGARTAAQSAVKDGAQLVLGPVFAEEVRAAKAATQSSNVSLIAFSTDWTVSGDNTFIMGFLPFDQVERVVGYAASKGLTRIGVLSPDSEYGRVVTSAYRNIASAKGIATNDITTFSGGDVSQAARTFARYDQRVAATSQLPPGTAPLPPPYDAVLLPVGGETAKGVGNLLSQYDLPARSVRRLGTGLWDDPSLASEAGLDGGWFAAPSPQSRAAFENRFNGLYRAPPPRLASLAYDATALAAILARTGIKQSGYPAFDRNSIANPNGFAGIDGIFRFRPDGNVERGLAILELSKGQIRVIDDAPRTFQQTRPVY